MRTDGTQLAGEAVAALRSTISKAFGPECVPENPRFYKKKAKNSQEAHEAIRPTKAGLQPQVRRSRTEHVDTHALRVPESCHEMFCSFYRFQNIQIHKRHD